MDPRRDISASMLYDYTLCEHRPWMDVHTDPKERDDVSPFLNLLWRRQRAHEEEAILNRDVLRLDAVKDNAARETQTVAAMRDGVPIIYQGRIVFGDLVGDPDLLLLEDGKYIPGDIKAGAGEEGEGDDRKPKKRYAVQLALYVDVLERLGFSAGKRVGFVWDVDNNEVRYELTAPKGKRTPESLWDDYEVSLRKVREIALGSRNTEPAYQGECKHCFWYSACMKRLEQTDDLTLLPGFGRAKRTPLLAHARTIKEFAALDPLVLIDEKGNSIVSGIGPESIVRFHERAVIKTMGGAPYRKVELQLPEAETELFFDIETDPGRNHCYLHGFVERRGGSEKFTPFFSAAPTAVSEREAFLKAFTYVQSHASVAIYIYSKYERTWWRALQERYPDVCTRADIDSIFDEKQTVDLLQVVQIMTEWPTKDHTIKTLARYLGFDWRDTHPSGYASIEWYDRYLSGDSAARDRILEYNEDDCRATRVLLDGIRALAPRAN